MSDLSLLLQQQEVRDRAEKPLHLKNSSRRLKRKRSVSSSTIFRRAKAGFIPCSDVVAKLLHSSWTAMFKDKNLDLQNVPKTELTGSKITIVASREANLVGSLGIIVEELQRCITVWIESENRSHRLLKKGAIIKLHAPNAVYLLDLSKFGEPSARHKRGIRGGE